MEPQLNVSSYDWTLLPQKPYLFKFTVSESGYCVVLTDLVSVFGESLKIDDVNQRFHRLNPFADVRPEKIMKNIEQGLTEFSTNQGKHILTIEDKQHYLVLDHSSNLVGLKYEVKLRQLPRQKMTDFILGPVIKCAAFCERKIQELQNMKGENSASVSGASNCNSTLSLVHSSSLDIQENESNLATEKHKLMNIFAGLQNFFNQLSLENIESSSSAEREITQSIKVRKLETKNVFTGPLKYEEDNSSPHVSVVHKPCDIDKKPFKRPKKKTLNL